MFQIDGDTVVEALGQRLAHEIVQSEMKSAQLAEAQSQIARLQAQIISMEQQQRAVAAGEGRGPADPPPLPPGIAMPGLDSIPGITIPD